MTRFFAISLVLVLAACQDQDDGLALQATVPLAAELIIAR